MNIPGSLFSIACVTIHLVSLMAIFQVTFEVFYRVSANQGSDY